MLRPGETATVVTLDPSKRSGMEAYGDRVRLWPDPADNPAFAAEVWFSGQAGGRGDRIVREAARSGERVVACVLGEETNEWRPVGAGFIAAVREPGTRPEGRALARYCVMVPRGWALGAPGSPESDAPLPPLPADYRDASPATGRCNRKRRLLARFGLERIQGNMQSAFMRVRMNAPGDGEGEGEGEGVPRGSGAEK